MQTTRQPTSIFVKYQDKQGQHRWRLVARNNRILADSGEGYRNEADRDHAIALVKDSYRSPVVKA